MRICASGATLCLTGTADQVSAQSRGAAAWLKDVSTRSAPGRPGFACPRKTVGSVTSQGPLHNKMVCSNCDAGQAAEP